MENLFPVLRAGGASNGAGSRIIWSQEQINYVISHYEKNHSTKELAELCGVSTDAIRRLLRKQGVKLKTVQQLGKEKHPRNSMYFHQIDTPEKAYWLGFLYADGYNNEKNCAIRINLQQSDENHLLKFLKAIEAYNFSIKHQTKKVDEKEYMISYVSFVDKQMSQDLALKGCFQGKSLRLKFPDKTILPSNLVSHFIRGYFDGDGSIYYSHRKNSDLLYFAIHILGTKHMLNQIKQYLKVKKLALENKKTHYSLNICGNKQCERVMRYLYQDSDEHMELTRKKDKFKILLLQRIGDEPTNVGCA